MPEPEIARRCPTCGASIREVALFCPQCGSALPQPEPAQAQARVAAPAEVTTSKTTTPLDDPGDEAPPPSMSDTVAIARPEKAVEPPRSMSDTIAIPKPEKTSGTTPGPRVRGAVGAKIQRAATLARDVEGDVKHRARKVRHMSSVVLDEAGYDPSLRFVLVALGLFVMFIIIVLLNKVIT